MSVRATPTQSLAFLEGGGEAGRLMRAFDWSGSALGPAEHWPPTLKTAVALMLQSKQPAYIGWGPDQVSLYNDGYIPICGAKHPAGFGRPAAELWAEIWDQLGPLNASVMAGEAQFFEDMPFALAGRGTDELSYFTFSYTPLRDETAAIRGIYCSAIETTDKVRGEERLRLMVNELNHRVKNSLATVQAIAAQTLRRADVPPSVRETLLDRLMALSRAHDVLTDDNWSGASLREMALQAAAPYDAIGAAGRFDIDGPPVSLPPKRAIAMALAFHELATNAAKYGALSTPSGRVRIAWTTSAGPSGPRLRLIWTESGGPPVQPPRTTGFGTRLIQRGLASELHGAIQVEYRESGVVCAIDADLGPEAQLPLPGARTPAVASP